MSSKHWSKTKNVGGLFDTLENANVIYLPYCSRDAHMADTEVEISVRQASPFVVLKKNLEKLEKL